MRRKDLNSISIITNAMQTPMRDMSRGDLGDHARASRHVKRMCTESLTGRRDGANHSHEAPLHEPPLHATLSLAVQAPDSQPGRLVLVNRVLASAAWRAPLSPPPAARRLLIAPALAHVPRPQHDAQRGAHIRPHAADRVLEPAHISRMELRLPVQMHDERGRLGVRLEHIEHSRREAMSSLGNQV